MKKVNGENSFLIIWIFCVILLLLLFPVSFIKGTRAYFDNGSDNVSGQFGDPYKIKYVSNFPSELNKESETYSQSVVSEYYIVLNNMFEADGYEFVNWNTKDDGTGDVYEVDSKYLDKLNLTLYAHWKKIEVIVISYGDINLNGTIDENDYVLVENHVSGVTELVGQALLNADVNNDEKIDLVDADIIKQAYLGTSGYVGILPGEPILIYEIYEDKVVEEPDSTDKPTEDDNIESEDKNDNDSNADSSGGIVEDGEITGDDSLNNGSNDGNLSGDSSDGDSSSGGNTDNGTGENSGVGNVGQGTESGGNSSSGSAGNDGGATTGGNAGTGSGTGSSGASGGGGNSSGSGNDSGSGNGNKPSTGNSNDDKKEETPKEDKEEVVESDKNNDIESDKNDVEEDKDNASSEKEEKKTGDSIVYVAIIVFGICLLSFRLILHVIYKFREKDKKLDVDDE